MPPASKKRRYALNIYLLNLPPEVKIDNTNGWHDAALKDASVKSNAVALPEVPGATLYTKQYSAGPPKWSKHFTKQVQRRLRNSSTGGLVLLSVDKQAIGISFGHGRHILVPTRIVESFGLKATVNLIGADRVRSIDKVTFDQITRHSRVQATQQGDVAAFQVNVDQDLVRAVTGIPEDKSLGPRLSGRDSLVMTAEMTDLSELPSVVRRALKAHKDTKYKKTFPWIDHVCEVRNSEIIKDLEGTLEDRIATRNYQRFWMSAPEIVDWERVVGFKYHDSNEEPLIDDLDAREFFANFRRRRSSKRIEIDHIKARRVYAYDAEGERLYSPWSAYQCIYFEAEHKDETYLLNLGRWYRIEKNYVERVNQHLQRIEEGTLVLPPRKGKETEPTYNKRAAKIISGAAHMDAKNLVYGGGRSRIEFCDILTKDPKRMIFAKRYGSSSSLSHLFSQAVVSTQLLKVDSDFRELVNSKLPKNHRFNTAEFASSDWEIIFAILSKSANPLVLPFFSRITLMVAHERLISMGYKVYLQKVAPRKVVSK